MTRWRPFVTAVAFSILPLAVFLSDNRTEAQITGLLIAITLAIVVAGVTLVALVRRWRGARDAERTAVCWATATVVIFQFAAVAGALDSIGIPATTPRYAGAAWLVLFAGTLLAARAASRAPLVWNWALVFGVALLTINAVPYASLELRDDDAIAAGARGPHPVAVRHAGRGGPDVYYFMLDGYGREDALQRLLGYDNGPFVRELLERGFDVDGRALTSYPTTALSQMTTFSLDYALTKGTLEALPRAQVARTLGGDNTTVSSLRRLGYDYVVADDFEGGCVGYEDVCIEPEPRSPANLIGMAERAYLGATPLAPVMPSILAPLSDSTKGFLTPDAVVREVLQRRGDKPIFVYGHIMAPHPPYRYQEDCSSPIPFDGELGDWGDANGAGGRGYATTVRCTNRELLRAIDMIDREERDAVIILQGDHGPGIGIDFDMPVLSWSDQQLLERYAILSAARFPRHCRENGRAPRLAVNTFRDVLSCLTGERLAPKRARYFAIGQRGGERVLPLPAERLTK